MLDELTEEDFAPHTGKRFLLERGEEERIALTLVEVRALPPPPTEWQELRQEPFALLFRGPRRPALVQGMHTLIHPTLGRIEGLFLVPTAEDREGRMYEAVFN